MSDINPKDFPIQGPFGTLAEFVIHGSTLETTLPAKDDFPATQVYTLALEGPQGKGYAKCFIPANSTDNVPMSGDEANPVRERFILHPPKKEGDLPKAARPKKGGAGKGGGGFKADPIEEAARQAMIIAQSARTAAIEEFRLMCEGAEFELVDDVQQLRKSIDDRVADITEQALAIGETERVAARGRR